MEIIAKNSDNTRFICREIGHYFDVRYSIYERRYYYDDDGNKVECSSGVMLYTTHDKELAMKKWDEIKDLPKPNYAECYAFIGE